MSSVLLDSNLLVLFIVGTCDQTKIGHVKGVKEYRIEHFEWVVERLSYHSELITLPNIISEVGNLVLKDDGELVKNAREILAGFTLKANENYIESRKVIKSKYFAKVGVCDSAIIDHSKTNQSVVLTADFALFGILDSLGCETYNIWHSFTPRK